MLKSEECTNQFRWMRKASGECILQQLWHILHIDDSHGNFRCMKDFHEWRDLQEVEERPNPPRKKAKVCNNCDHWLDEGNGKGRCVEIIRHAETSQPNAFMRTTWDFGCNMFHTEDDE